MDAERGNFCSDHAGAALVEGHCGLVQRDGDIALELFLIQVDLEGAVVISIVIDAEQQMVDTCGLAGIQRERSSVAHLGILGGAANSVKNLALIIVDQDRGRDVAVIACVNNELLSVVHQVFLEVNLGDLRSGLIDIGNIGHGCAIGERVPIGHSSFTAVIDIVFRSHGHADVQLGTFRSVGCGREVQAGASALPGTAVGVVISGGRLLVEFLAQVFLAVVAGDIHTDVRCVTDEGEVHLRKGRGVGVVGVTIFMIEIFFHIGIAAEVVQAGIAGVLHGEALILQGIVAGSRVHIRNTVLHAVGILEIAADVVHGSIGPAAVIAENGDGVLGALFAFCAGKLRSVDIAFNIGAGAIAGLVIHVKHSLAELCGHGNMDRAICGNLNGALAETLEEEVCIVGVDVAVLAEVSVCLVIDFGTNAGDIVKQSLTVVSVDLAVAVEVAVLHTGSVSNLDGLAVDIPGDVGSNRGSPSILEVRGRAVADVVCKHVLREEVRIEIERGSGIFHVVNGEAEGVQAGAVSVFAELGLDLAVLVGIGCVGIHQDVAAAGNSCADVGKASALTEHGIVTIALAANEFFIHRSRGRHQQRLRQCTGGQAGLCGQVVLSNVLADNSCHTGNLRGGHGGTGHVLIGAAVLQGIDVAARSGDFRL